MNRSSLLSLTTLGASFIGMLPSTWAQPQPTQSLVINELNIGGVGPQFLEIRNTSAEQQSLDGVLVESSQGTIRLDYQGPLAPGGYFVVIRSATDGGDGDADGQSLSIGQPLMHVMKDTLLLKRGDEILDAISYGTSCDDSARYAKAIDAGQFDAGSFVDISTCSSSVNLGRSKSSADSNDLQQDWSLHGGADSFQSSIGADNARTMSREKETVRHFQTLMNQAFVNVLGANVQFADHSLFRSGSPSTTAHSFSIDSLEFGSHILVGNGSDEFVPLASGQYDIVSNGTFADDSLLVYARFVDQVRTSSMGRTLDLIVITPDGDQFEYQEVLDSRFSGAWGDLTVDHTRTVVAWDGITRNTQSSQRISWDPQEAEVSSVHSTLDLTRDFPAQPPTIGDYANWRDGGADGSSPCSPYTTEAINFECEMNAVADGLEVVFRTYEIDHGSYGSATQDNALLTVTRTGESQVDTTYTYDFNGPVSAHVEHSVRGKVLFPSEDVMLQGTISQDGDVLSELAMYIDPVRSPLAAVDSGFWDWVVWGAATFVTGAVCAVGTAVATGATVVVGTVTLGTGVPAGVVGIGATGGACAVVTGAACNGLWPE